MVDDTTPVEWVDEADDGGGECYLAVLEDSTVGRVGEGAV